MNNVPAVVVVAFTISVICMNLLANKTILQRHWIALDGGILVSWLSFLCMDVVTRHFGPRASVQLSIFASTINILTCILFNIAANISFGVAEFEAFDTIFSSTWFILFSSTIAFLVSSITNNFLNNHISKRLGVMMGDGLNYFVSMYVSTFVGQFIDNLIFSTLVFMVFAPIYWNGFCWTFIQCFMCALSGAVAELFMEVVFSPIGYKVTKLWKHQGVGLEYFSFVNRKDVVK